MLHLVYNPAAGRGGAPAALARALAILDEAGAEYRLETSAGPGHATELAAATPTGAVVVAVGGDGTVHEVVKGLVSGENPGEGVPYSRTLAVLPVGSGDDFAFAMGLNRRDLPGAVARLLEPKPTLIDLGSVNGEPFVNGVGVGFDAEVAENLRRAPRLLRGLSAYLYAVLVTLGSLRPRTVRIVVNGTEVYHGPSLLVAAQNGPRTGGSFLFAPEAVNNDGLLDIVIAEDLRLFGTLGLLPRVMRGTHLSHPRVRLLRGASLTLEWEAPRSAHAEGEPLLASTYYELSLDPRRLKVLGP